MDWNIESSNWHFGLTLMVKNGFSFFYYFKVECAPSELMLPSAKNLPRKAELAWQVRRYLWRQGILIVTLYSYLSILVGKIWLNYYRLLWNWSTFQTVDRLHRVTFQYFNLWINFVKSSQMNVQIVPHWICKVKTQQIQTDSFQHYQTQRCINGR